VEEFTRVFASSLEQPSACINYLRRCVCVCVIIPIFFNLKLKPRYLGIGTVVDTQMTTMNFVVQNGKRQRIERLKRPTAIGLDKCPACDIANEDDALHRTITGNYHPGCVRWLISEERWQMLEHFSELSRCKCCDRHQKRRPQSLESGWIETPRSTYGNMCECDCRHNMRYMCRVVQGGFIDRE